MWEAPVDRKRTSVGLDVHARSVVACGLDGVTGQLHERTLTPDHGELLGWLRGLPGRVEVAYEAGPTGFGLARFLTGEGIVCRVAAPSRLQRPCGDRVKTDKRDARHLARLLHLDEVVEVTVPSVEQEAARDVVRAREDVRGDLMSARHRLSKLLLRQGIVYSGGKPWTAGHHHWLRSRRRLPIFDQQPGLGLAFDIAYDTLLATLARRDRLDAAITEMATCGEYAPVVVRLGCLRGVSTLTAFGLAVEIGDRQRLTGRTIGAYLGLVPTESSSGASRSQGSITKTGNAHARRLVIEAAWHHRRPNRPSAVLRRRQDLASPAARNRGERANR
jgi:transposase